MRRLANFAIAHRLQSAAGCGDALGLFGSVHGLPPKLQRGCCRQPLCNFRRFFLNCISILPNAFDFQLVVLITFRHGRPGRCLRDFACPDLGRPQKMRVESNTRAPDSGVTIMAAKKEKGAGFCGSGALKD